MSEPARGRYDPLVVADALSFRYPRGGASVELDLRVRAGEIVGLLGPNGAGKSTFLKLVATVLAPSAGTLRIVGREAHPPGRELLRSIGYAGHEPAFPNALTGREDASFFARASGMEKAAAMEAVARLAAALGFSEHLDRPIATYSSGTRRKLLIAEALAHAPPVVVLDEPSAGLDAAARPALHRLLRERARNGAAVILSTHDADEARRLCHRVLFVHGGRVVLDGEPEALLRAHGSATRIQVAVEGESFSPLPLVAGERLSCGVLLERVEEGRIHALSEEGAAALPDLCAELIERGARIRAIEVRPPDLADVFYGVTGSDLFESAARPHSPATR